MNRNLNRRIHPIAEADGLSPKNLVKSLLPAHERGKNLVIDTCPFCGEKNVMAFSPDKEVAKCFRCGISVTILGLVVKVKNCTRQEAEKYINKNL